MVEVVKYSETRKQIICPNCDSTLSYTSKDEYIKEEYDHLLRLEIHKHYIICPICNKHIKVRERIYDCL